MIMIISRYLLDSGNDFLKASHETTAATEVTNYPDAGDLNCDRKRHYPIAVSIYKIYIKMKVNLKRITKLFLADACAMDCNDRQSEISFTDADTLASRQCNEHQLLIFKNVNVKISMCLAPLAQRKNTRQEDISPSQDPYSAALPENFIDGRRIVDLRYLATQMVCQQCETDIHLRDFISEQRYGAASELTFQCSACGLCRFVSTSTDSSVRNSAEDRRSRVFDINCKIVIGKTGSQFK
jgi:hypothetical protein